ncbi:MAG: magnesium transporter, partial [Mycobacterium sp.]
MYFPAKALELWLDLVDDPAERTYELSRLSSADRRRLGESLDAAVGPQLLEGVDVHLAAKVVKSLPVPRAAELLTAV